MNRTIWIGAVVVVLVAGGLWYFSQWTAPALGTQSVVTDQPNIQSPAPESTRKTPSAAPTSGPAPLTVTFIYSFPVDWRIKNIAGDIVPAGIGVDFGDGSEISWKTLGVQEITTMSLQHTSHTYSKAGTYTTKLVLDCGKDYCQKTQIATITVSAQSATAATKDYKGAWFKIIYPANFVAKAEVPDEASFTSPDGSVQFYVYSPQWSGNPVSYIQASANETIENDTSTPSVTPFTNQYGTTYDKKVTRYVTFAAKDGSYKRSFVSITAGSVTSPESEDYASKTHLVFGIKYKDQATYDTYLNDYLAFKKSLVQYAD